MKAKIIDWTIFSSGLLSRFDLSYIRDNKRDDKISIEEFLYQCLGNLEKLEEKSKPNRGPNISFDRNSKGRILRVGHRGSNLSYRIYNGETFLKFEHEMKQTFIKKYHPLLASNRLEEFEQQLSLHFFSYSAKKLPLHYTYMDWLVIKIRSIRKQQIPESGLNSHYLDPNTFQSFTDRKNFLSLLQFLMYAQQLDFTRDYLGSTPYRQVVFRLQDFLKYQNSIVNVKSTNYPQLKKVKDFFQELQKNLLIQSFTDFKYRSLVTIPQVELEKSKQNQNCWIAKVWIAEELFDYVHPFLLPSFFKQKTTKDQFEVQFKIIQVFSSINIEKTFLVKEFLDSYSAVLFNQRRTKIKKLFLQFVGLLKEHDLIESNSKIISDGLLVDVDELTTTNIEQDFVLYEKLSI